MASLDQREGDRPALAPHLPHFFKIILPETLLQEKLKIPKKFVRKHGNTLLDSVLLEVPSGRVWQIDLTRYDNGEVWLETGWKLFVEYYSLSPGHLVAFRYEGTSKFCVFIYDVGSSEINYQPHNVCGEEGDKDAISVENLDDSNLQTLPQKRKRTNSATEINNGAKQKKTTDLKTVKSENDAYDSTCEEQDIEGTQRATNLQKVKLAELLNCDSYLHFEDDSVDEHTQVPDIQLVDSQPFSHQVPDSPSHSSSSHVSAKSISIGPSLSIPLEENFGRWTTKEDMRLVACWLRHSKDSVKGNNKLNNTFWGVIEAKYNSDPRFKCKGRNQLKNHWNRVNPRVKRFNGYFLHAKSVNTNGQSDNKLYKKAIKMYESNEKPKHFAYQHWWKAVRYESKWIGEEGTQADKRTRFDEASTYSSSPTPSLTVQDFGSGSQPGWIPNPVQRASSPLPQVRPQETKVTKSEGKNNTQSGKDDLAMTLEIEKARAEKTKQENIKMAKWGELNAQIYALEEMDTSQMTSEQLTIHRNRLKRHMAMLVKLVD